MGVNRRSMKIQDVDLDQLYEPCIVAHNLILPRGGHFAVSAATTPEVIPGIITDRAQHAKLHPQTFYSQVTMHNNHDAESFENFNILELSDFISEVLKGKQLSITVCGIN